MLFYAPTLIERKNCSDNFNRNYICFNGSTKCGHVSSFSVENCDWFLCVQLRYF